MSNASEPRLAESLNTKLHRLSLILIFAWVILNGFRPVMDNVDLGWHVAQGRWMVQHLAFYHQDVFNYPNLNHAAIDEYPVFQVVLYLMWQLGWWGPCLLTAALYAVVVGVLFRAGRLLGLTNSPLLVVAIGAMLLYFQIAFPLRPHLVTYVCVAWLGTFLLRHRDAQKWNFIWPMVSLQIIWVNSHSAFILGPLLVGLFGFEVSVRRWLREAEIPWSTIHTWLTSFLLIFLACFINPYGLPRFYLPFYQDRLESIRAYVGEMEPLGGGLNLLYQLLTAIAVLVVLLAALRHRAMAWSFLLPALLLYVEAQSVKKAWPTFGLFLPLLVLGSAAFSSSPRASASWASVLSHFLCTVLAALALDCQLNSSWPTSLSARWRDLAEDRSELSVAATRWMKAHDIEGPLFHRCEDGGWLQQEGFDQGQTFADTGFGKYDEAFIHEVGLVNERPALVPRYLHDYLPEYVVCGTFCYQWPYYLRQNGWRLIFYSPNSSVWTQPGTRPDLPTVPWEEVRASFDHDLATNGRPNDIGLFGRNLIALNSMGQEDFAIAQLTALPASDHHAPWYWEAARFICFADPPASPAHRQALFDEAVALHDEAVTSEFRAYDLQATGDVVGAQKLLEGIPKENLGNNSAELLLKIYLAQKNPEALPLARRLGSFDLRNGRHWQYLAQAEEAAGNIDAAAAAWKKAVFYYPDDDTLLAAASAFAAAHQDAALAQAIAASSKPYGSPWK